MLVGTATCTVVHTHARTFNSLGPDEWLAVYDLKQFELSINESSYPAKRVKAFADSNQQSKV